MSWYQAKGKARVDPRNPRAFGHCDRCYFLYNLDQLQWQYEWAGQQLVNQHWRVCPTCMDIPQNGLRTVILPPDPVPVKDPRPGTDSAIE